ncbi:MAG TPA: MFS transporter [Gemmatimonadaceae bacterium]|nr:MFS transporter [Gemmatimonadaceae bacterium]
MAHTLESVNPFRTLVRHRNFRLFWIGQTLSLMGTWMQTMAQGWLALQLSNSAFLVGLVSSIGSLPILVLSLPAGVLADRVSKLRLVTICQALLLCEAAALWGLTWTHRITIAWLLVLAAVNGIASAFEIPSRQALMIELVGRDDLHDAIALNSSGFNLARIIGPAIGAFVIATAGIAWCFGVNALSYLAVLVGLAMIRLPARDTPVDDASPFEGLKEGLRYMDGTREISVLMRLITVYAVCGIPYLTLMPVVARDLLGTGAGGYGVLLACVGIGGLTGALFLAAVGQRFRRGQLLMISSYGFAGLLIVFSLTRSEWLARVLLLALGCMMIMNGALSNGMLQAIVPDALRGRVLAAYSLVVVGLAQVVGSFVSGAVAHAVGVDWAIGAGGAIMLAYALFAFRRYPEMREL